MFRLKPDRAAWLKAEGAQCNIAPAVSTHRRRLILLGAPGIGKGTQAELLSQRRGGCHLSTGDIFRAAKALDACQRTPAMEFALDCMRRGELVADEIVLRLVAERAGCLGCRGGFILDGFPCNVAQAEALDRVLAENGVTLEAVLGYHMPLEKIVSRLNGRRTCSVCRAVFHVTTRPPTISGVCDHCGSTLYQREDDHPEFIRVRMEEYEKNADVLLDYYQKKGLLIPIAAHGTPEEVYERTMRAFGEYATSLNDSVEKARPATR